MTLNPRQNWFEVINWGEPEYIPMTLDTYALMSSGTTLPAFDDVWIADGDDPFGVSWRVDSFGAMPDVSKPPLLDDIADWEKVVKFPNIDDFDFKAQAHELTKDVDRSEKVVMYLHSTGIWERLEAFMGVVEACIALASDPDSCRDFFEAVTDYKIKCAGKIIDAYRPDVYVNADDIATANNLFMSPEMYREIILPSHKRFWDYIASRDIVVSQHTCGHCEEVVQDFVDGGVQLWHSVQVMNDIPAIQEKFKGKLTLEGAWDTSGKPGMIGATEQDVREETIHICEDWGKNGGLILLPVITNEHGHTLFTYDDRLQFVFEEWGKHRMYDK